MQLDAELAARYPASAIHGLHAGDAADPELVFLVARVDGLPVGCGVLRRLAPGVGEVKRMFVLATHRGQGVGRAVLAALEDKAYARGDTLLRLETGARQPEATALYRAAGYTEIDPYGEYTNDPFSVCFEKQLR